MLAKWSAPYVRLGGPVGPWARGPWAWFVAERREVDHECGVEGFFAMCRYEDRAQDGVLVAVVGGVDREAEGVSRAAVTQALAFAHHYN